MRKDGVSGGGGRSYEHCVREVTQRAHTLAAAAAARDRKKMFMGVGAATALLVAVRRRAITMPLTTEPPPARTRTTAGWRAGGRRGAARWDARFARRVGASGARKNVLRRAHPATSPPLAFQSHHHGLHHGTQSRTSLPGGAGRLCICHGRSAPHPALPDHQGRVRLEVHLQGGGGECTRAAQGVGMAWCREVDRRGSSASERCSPAPMLAFQTV
jgi:hypothetical protein